MDLLVICVLFHHASPLYTYISSFLLLYFHLKMTAPESVTPFHPYTTICISGCTQSGKSTFARRLLTNMMAMFSPVPPKKVLYCYGLVQSVLDMPKVAIDVDYHKGVPSEEIVNAFTNGNEHTMIILDDLIQDMVDNKDVLTLFTRTSHHLKVTILYITQNIFMQGRQARGIALNTHYLILFRNARDASQIATLGRQVYPGRGNAVVEAYNDATKSRYGYILLDFNPHSHEELRMRTNIFPEETTIVYGVK